MNNLPKFKQTIQVVVDVDSIYNELLSTFPEDYKHREILAHAIIGSTYKHGTIAYVYNSMHGFSNLPNFEVGDLLMCTSKERKVYKEDDEPIVVGAKRSSSKDYDWIEIGKCEVIEIDMYADSKLKVKFMQVKENGESEERTCWVSHRNCDKIQLPEMVEVHA